MVFPSLSIASSDIKEGYPSRTNPLGPHDKEEKRRMIPGGDNLVERLLGRNSWGNHNGGDDGRISGGDNIVELLPGQNPFGHHNEENNNETIPVGDNPFVELVSGGLLVPNRK